MQLRGPSVLKRKRRSSSEKEKTRMCKQTWKRTRNRWQIAEEARKKTGLHKSSSWPPSTTTPSSPSENTPNLSAPTLTGIRWVTLMSFTTRWETTNFIIQVGYRIRQSRCRLPCEHPTTNLRTEAETKLRIQTNRAKKALRCQFRIWWATRADPRICWMTS